jgi:hypothetical protein
MYLSSHSATGVDQAILNRPAGLSDGQQLGFWIESFGEAVTWTFTPLQSGTVTVAGAGSGRPSVWSWATKIASSEPATRTLLLGGGNSLTCKAGTFALSGRTSGNPTVQETDVAGDSASPVSTALAGLTAAAGDDIVALVGIASGNATGSWAFTPPAGFTLRETAVGNGAFSGGGIAICTLDNHAGGVLGTQTGTWTLATFGGESTGVLMAYAQDGGGGGSLGLMGQACY